MKGLPKDKNRKRNEMQDSYLSYTGQIENHQFNTNKLLNVSDKIRSINLGT